MDRPYRLDETEPSAPSGGPHLKKQKSDFFEFGLYIFLQHPKISSTTHFHYEWISPSTVLRNFWTHPKFCATPWYIESLSSDFFPIVWLTSYGGFRRKTIQNVRFLGWALLGYIIRTIYFPKTDFLRIHILKSPDFMKK